MRAIIALCLCLSLSLLAGCTETYDDGWSAGYDEGYEEAKSIFYEEGYQDGYSEGEEIGLESGQESGYSDGYKDGYSEGHDDALYGNRELHFWRSYAVIVTTVGSKYHTFGCGHLENRDFYIFNIDLAVGEGYTPCLDCIS